MRKCVIRRCVRVLCVFFASPAAPASCFLLLSCTGFHLRSISEIRFLEHVSVKRERERDKMQNEWIGSNGSRFFSLSLSLSLHLLPHAHAHNVYQAVWRCHFVSIFFFFYFDLLLVCTFILIYSAPTVSRRHRHHRHHHHRHTITFKEVYSSTRSEYKLFHQTTFRFIFYAFVCQSTRYWTLIYISLNIHVYIKWFVSKAFCSCGDTLQFTLFAV